MKLARLGFEALASRADPEMLLYEFNLNKMKEATVNLHYIKVTLKKYFNYQLNYLFDFKKISSID